MKSGSYASYRAAGALGPQEPDDEPDDDEIGGDGFPFRVMAGRCPRDRHKAPVAGIPAPRLEAEKPRVMAEDDMEMVRALAAALVLPALIRRSRSEPDDLERARLVGLSVEFADRLVERLAIPIPTGKEASNG